jgi:spore coat protein U-like protein
MRFVAALLLGGCCATAVAQSCHVEATPVAFGRYDPSANSATVVRGEILLSCTAGTRLRGAGLQVNLLLDGPVQRRLAGPAGELHYSLFQDAALSRPWWQGAPRLLAPDSDGRGGLQARIPVYARIAPGQWVAPGAYADQIALRIEF